MDGCAAGIKSRVYDFGLYLGYETLELATMGIRAIIDCVVTSRVGDIGGFARKLETMRNEGLISEIPAEIINAAFNAGSAAVHR